MGFDLLEDGDYFPLSRVGKNFVNDTDYHEILGIGAGKKRARSEARTVEEKFPELSAKATCEQVEERLVALQVEMDVQRGKITAGDKSKWYRQSLGKLEEMMAKTKLMYSNLKCLKTQEQADLQKSQSDILGTLAATTQAAGSTPTKTMSKTTKYAVYGIAGLFVLGAIFIVLKPSK